MLTIPNVATQDSYVDALTLGPVALAERIVYVVANAAALAQIAGIQADGTLRPWGDEFVLTPQSNIVQRAGGIRFRSAVAGVPAQIVAQLIQPDDPAPGAGTPFTAKLASSGAVTPGTSAVQIQKDGALIGTEVTLDFLTAGGGSGAVLDDAANTRVTISIPRKTVGLWNAGPPAAPNDGDIWVATAPDTNNLATTDGTRWVFQYNATSGSAKKWECIGGTELFLIDTSAAARANTLNATWQNITGLSTFTTARAADFLTRVGNYFEIATNPGDILSIGVAKNGAVQPPTSGDYRRDWVNSGGQSHTPGPFVPWALSCAAADVISGQMWSSPPANVALLCPWLGIMPKRCA